MISTVNIDWLLSGEPREAQLEALRRSYRGVATMDAPEDTPFFRPVPGANGEPLRGWGHFLEMRVGKTPTTLNEGALFRRDFNVNWSVILTPNAFKDDWPAEAAKFNFGREGYSFDSSASGRKKFKAWFDKNRKHGGLIAVNYESLKYQDNVDVLDEVFKERVYLAADESISLKNHASEQTKAAIYFGKQAAVTRLLSGKPITQGPQDLYPQLRFVKQLEGILFPVFKAKYCETGGFMGKQVVGIRNEDDLHRILDRCSWNARKSVWLKTPGVDYVPPRVLKLLPEQAKKYAAMEQDFITELENGVIVSADQIVTKYLKMQQIASGFVIDEDGQTHDIVPMDKNPKLLEMRRMMEQDFRGKVIVVAHATRSMDMLLEVLKPWNPAVIRGDIWHDANGRDKLAEKARFNLDPNCRVMIGQTIALRYGHTLMGNPQDPCHDEVFYENSFSLNDRSQCEQRAQGAGQISPIAIWDFYVTQRDRDCIGALQAKEDIAAITLRYERATGILPHGSR